jgi:hypothetical protein
MLRDFRTTSDLTEKTSVGKGFSFIFYKFSAEFYRDGCIPVFFFIKRLVVLTELITQSPTLYSLPEMYIMASLSL